MINHLFSLIISITPERAMGSSNLVPFQEHLFYHHIPINFGKKASPSFLRLECFPFKTSSLQVLQLSAKLALLIFKQLPFQQSISYNANEPTHGRSCCSAYAQSFVGGKL